MRIDRVLHFLASWALVDILAPFIGLHAAMFAALTIGIGKEVVWDLWMEKGDPDPTDMIANAVGIGFGSLWWSEYLLIGLWVFWAAYVFTMGLYRALLTKRLKGLSLLMSSPLVAFAFVLDFLAQMTVFTVLFMELPRHLLVTNRLRAYMRGPDTWRRRIADHLCHHLLDPFDPTGAHCDSDTPTLKA